ncbi:hypothetical protein BGZ54_000237, partial [Gamsiella multidivaricata]
MARLNQVSLFLAVLLLVFKTANASYAYCIGLHFDNDILYSTKASFSLWDDAGDNAAQYRTIYSASKTTLQNNGWTLNLGINQGNIMTSLMISSNKYSGLPSSAYYESLCSNGYTNFYYGCFEDGN